MRWTTSFLVAKPDAKIFRPAQELKGFARVSLEPGESKTVSIPPLDDKAFRYWNQPAGHWAVEGGEVHRPCGLFLRGHPPGSRPSRWESSGDTDPYIGDALSALCQRAQVQEVPEVEFSAILGRPIAQYPGSPLTAT